MQRMQLLYPSSPLSPSHPGRRKRNTPVPRSTIQPTLTNSLRRAVLCLSLAFVSNGVNIQVSAAAEEPTTQHERIEQVLVIGKPDKIPGAGNVVNAEELERFDYSDINQVLSNVPGVYIREEDGYGLRPNIGIRGAAAERSLKITLMEDGVLITPAPYSAPAAYYVPNINRMSSVEVLKGPAAIQTGPHTVGGAINLLTHNVPTTSLRELDLSFGTDAFYKTSFSVGGPIEDSAFGYLINGLSYGTNGFKKLDSGGDTGFVRNDLNLKLRWVPQDDFNQQFTLKLAYANEDADETYLGLTDHDFRSDPIRRYRASQLANFQSEHINLHLNHGIAIGDVSVNTKVYWNSFERAWNKLGGYVNGRSLLSILVNPHLFESEYQLLLGHVDSFDLASQTLEITNADRSFASQGIQIAAVGDGTFLNLDHVFTAGFRLHQDRVKRHHQPRGYLMSAGSLEFDGLQRPLKALDQASSTAFALFATEELTWQDLTFTLGLRFENIEGEFKDLNRKVQSASRQSVLSPGIGLFWQATQPLGLLAGVYKGFSPAGPGKNGVDPEQSLNYETGIRVKQPSYRLEAVAFLSNYENLLGRCRVNDAGCEAGQEFNGGEVEINGIEVDFEWLHELDRGMQINAGYVYTLTNSEFKTNFLSGFSQWGLVRAGDELPYLPRHRSTLHMRLAKHPWEVAIVAKQQSMMREQPGSTDIGSGLHADAYQTVDFSASWQLRDSTMLQFVAGNMLDELAIVSHRPLGARPNRPRWLSMRVRHNF